MFNSCFLDEIVSFDDKLNVILLGKVEFVLQFCEKFFYARIFFSLS